MKNEMDVRKQVEGDIYKIKKGLEEQVNKEKSQRDEISKQLQIMKGKNQSNKSTNGRWLSSSTSTFFLESRQFYD